MSKKKSFVFKRREALYSKDGTTAITHLSNVPKLELYIEMLYVDFIKWNIEQEKRADWWIATAPFYALHKIVSYFGWSLEEFKVLVPKVTRPIVFEFEGMCLLVAPYCGYNWTGVMDWKENDEVASNHKQETEANKQ
jgi:hypothetical protein